MAQDPLQGDKIRLKLMKRVFTLILTAFAVAACSLSAPPKKTKPASTAPASSQHKPARTAQAHSASKTRARSSAVRVKYVRGRNGKLIRVGSSAPAPAYQLHPDPERYQQIQQALADKGYFKGQVNGVWSDDSVDALKRFQSDQKLDNDGRLNALTLIGLGLGPKHDSGTAAVVAPNGASNSATKTGPPVPPPPSSTSTNPGATPPESSGKP